MAVFYFTALLVVVFALAVLLLVASEAAGRAGGDQTQLAHRLRRVLRHLNGEAEPPAGIANTLMTRDNTAAAGRTAHASAAELPEPTETIQADSEPDTERTAQTSAEPIEADAAPAAQHKAAPAAAGPAPKTLKADKADKAGEPHQVGRHLAA